MCHHANLDIKVDHVALTDCNVGALRFKATCKDCGAAMRLSRGLVPGASSKMATGDGTEGGIMVPVIAMDEEPSQEWGLDIEIGQH